MPSAKGMTMTFRRFLPMAVVLALLFGVGQALPAEYNTAGRDMYGNTAEQNEAMRSRGAVEKALFAREETSREKAENKAFVHSLIPGAIVLIGIVVVGVVVIRRIYR